MNRIAFVVAAFVLAALLPFAACEARLITPKQADLSTLSQKAQFASAYSNERQLVSDIFGTGSADLIYLNRNAEIVIICKNQLAENCHSYAFPGLWDVIVVQDAQGARQLLAFSKEGTVSKCTSAQNQQLDCAPVDLSSPPNGLRVAQAKDRTYLWGQNGNETYRCVLKPSRYPVCNASHLMTAVKPNALLIGTFNASTLQAVQFRGGVVQVCKISLPMASCLPATGLNVATGDYQVASLYNPSGNRSAVVIRAGKMLAVCGLRSDVSRAFVCEMTTMPLDTSESRERVFTARTKSGEIIGEHIYIDLNYRALGTSARAVALAPAVQEMQTTYRGAYARAFAKPILIAAQSGKRISTRPVICDTDCGAGTPPSLGGDFGGAGFTTSYYDGSDNYLGGFDYFSDEDYIYDFWSFTSAWFDPTNPSNRAECHLNCDTTRSAGYASCDNEYNLVLLGGAFVTGVVVIWTAETVAGAYTIYRNGYSITEGLAEGVARNCKNNADKMDLQCRLTCDAGHY